MRLAIVGTRELHAPVSYIANCAAIACHHWYEVDLVGVFRDAAVVTEVVSGGARGIDRAAEAYAESIGLVPKVFEPTWRPSNAGNVKAMMAERNQEIVNYADAMVAIRLPGHSPGTDDAITRMKAAGKPVFVFEIQLQFKECHNGDCDAPSR